MTAHDIIAKLAQERVVEQIVQTVCKVSRSELDDLAQIIYEAMLRYDEQKIIALWERNQLSYFIVRIVQNQFYSETSPFYTLFRKFSRRSAPVDAVANKQDDESA